MHTHTVAKTHRMGHGGMVRLGRAGQGDHSPMQTSRQASKQTSAGDATSRQGSTPIDCGGNGKWQSIQVACQVKETRLIY